MIKKRLLMTFRVVLYSVGLLAVSCGFGLLVSQANVSADASSLMAKWQNAMYYNCQSQFAVSVEAGGDNDKVINSVLVNNASVEYLPSYNYSGQGASLSCVNVVDSKVSGLSSVTWKNITNAETILKNMGYTVVNGDRNFTINASITSEDCTKNYYADSPPCTTTTRETESATITARYNSSDGLYYYQLLHPWVGNVFKDIKITFSNHNMIISDGTNSHSEPLVNDPSDFLNNLRNSLANVNWDAGTTVELLGDTGEKTSHSWYNFSFSNLDKSGASKYYYPKADSYAAANKLSSPSLNDSDLNATERYNLYMYYLTHAITAANNGFVSNPDNKNGLTEVKYRKSDGSSGSCYANLSGAKTDTLYTLSMAGVGSNRYPRIVTISLDGVIQWLNNVDISKIGSDAVAYCDETTPPNPNPTPTGGGGTINPDKLDCDSMVNTATDGEGIGAMQWILCPAMNNTRYTASWVDEMTDDWLSLPNNTVYGSGGETEQVWSVVRNVANVLMIVFLLLIIFSQLTGYGIDNYGIKKMLPRLIVMAIIVNLSFYICQIAVDLSNIFGVGLRNMFGSFYSAAGDDAIRGTNFLGGMITGLFATAGGASAAMGAGTTLIVGLGAPIAVAVVVAVIVLCLVILVAVVTLFLMLGLRQIIVIMCIVLAPLAFAAFILPNTQSMFKKWWGLFEAALIIYPICGAVGGISYLLRSMAANGLELSVWGYAVMMILPYLVFFLLPTLLNTAIAALGKVGGALSRMGSNIKSSGRAIGQGAMKIGQNTEAFKNLQSEAARQRQQRNAQRVVDNVNKKEAGGGVLNARDKMRRLNAQQTLNRLKQEQYMADLGAPVLSDEVALTRAESAKEAQEIKNYTDQYGGLTRTQMATELDRAAAAYDSDRSNDNAIRLQAAIAAAEGRGMNKEMLNGSLAKLGLSSSDNNDAKILGRMAASQNKVLSQYGKQVGKQTAPEGASVRRMSVDRFAGSEDLVKMSDAFANQGSNVLNGMDDDTLQYISEHGRPAASTEMLINAANSTTNEKELTQINSMLGSATPDSFSFSAKQLAGMKIGSLNAIKSQVMVKGSAANNAFVKATNDIANSPELMTSLRPEQRAFFNEIRGDNKFGGSQSSGSKFVVGFH